MTSHSKSFLVLLAVIFLLPIIFAPASFLSLPSLKVFLLCLGLVVATLIFFWESWRKGSIAIPRHYLIWVVAALPPVYSLSALLTTPSSLSLLGYNFEVGTTGSILLGAALLLLVAMTLTETKRVLQVMSALFIALALVALLTGIKVFFGGDLLTLGNFAGNMGNPLGSWTDLSIALGLLSILTLFVITMLPMNGLIKALLYIALALSFVLFVAINFSSALWVAAGALVLVLVYLWRTERQFLHSEGESGMKNIMLIPGILLVIVLAFAFNLGGIATSVSSKLGIANTEVRPTLSATLSISKAVLTQSTFLGSGPNTFDRDWLIHKPLEINSTPFWSLAFPFGAGFIPTQIATTGILGTFFWLAFLVLLVALGAKAFNHIPESRAARFTVVTSFTLSLILWSSMFFYTPSIVMLMLAFAFTGIFVASLVEAKILETRHLTIRNTEGLRFGGALLVLVLTLGALYLGFLGGKKALAAYHFQKAVVLSNTAGTPLANVEKELDEAVKLDPVDAHYLAVSRINFAKAQVAVNASTGTPETNLQIFQDAVGKSLTAARAAVTANPASYGNWVALGQIYSSLVPAPLNVEGAYENAQLAYNEAYKRNPSNPELPLLLARLELSRNNVENARSFVRSSIALKPDYADAYLLLAQLEISQNNLKEAIQSAEVLSKLTPDNAGIHFELGLLKFSAKDYEGATASFTKALEITPTYANAKYYLALSLAQQGEKAEAKKLLEELLAQNPDVPELKAELEKLNK